ncbi:hypothetical protein Q5P01_016330 [Channa striata]|uniref:GTPase IMAP family member 8 n=1 Tax=Channa striata TaxID=64152 RepID=A0AA88MHN4_CHASR|nr:hypothetical protein Q5P01_016330 [Channa striata]
MENNLGEKESIILSEVRLILVGGRWAGKSSSGNTILRKTRFECGRTRTAQSEVRQEVVEGRRLIVVDAPGWSSSLSLTEIPEGDKQRFKLNVSKCPPGPHVFLLHKRTVEAHMKLLGKWVWSHTMVLFTCEDFLGDKTIEQHIEKKCSHRYHVFNNKKNSDLPQVTMLLEKIEEMVANNNNGSYYEVEEQMLNIIKKKQRDVDERAEKRRRQVEQQRKETKTLITEMNPISNLRMILLGSRSVGKTSLGNSILANKALENGKRTIHSVAQLGFVDKTEITVVDTPGWWKDFAAFDTPKGIKDELRRSMFLCRPGPHVFLVVVDADASFNANHLEAVTTHVELLGKGVWRHTLVIFTRGDWLGTHTIEEYIEGEGEALQKKKRVEERARLRKKEVETRRKYDPTNKLQELRIVMLGQKSYGKSATGNNLLCKEVFTPCEKEHCQKQEAEVSGRGITVINTPGWWKESSFCTKEMDKEIVRGFSLSPSGVHAVLLVVTLDLTFREVQQNTLEEYMNLFDSSIWKHTMILFTHGDKLADKSVEEHIESEHGALCWLVDKCENRYHVMNNMKKNDMNQVTELFEKIEEMIESNHGELFCPDMYDVHLRIEEKFKRRQLKHVLKQRVVDEYKRKELELKMSFKEILLELQAEIRGSGMSPKSKSPIGDMAIMKYFAQRKKDQNQTVENIDAKISQEIEKLDKDLLTSTEFLRNSKGLLVPDLKEEQPAQLSDFDKVLGWLSALHIDTNVENQLTLNFSDTSGYRTNQAVTFASVCHSGLTSSIPLHVTLKTDI